MGVLPQVLEIIFEVQRKMSKEKITIREINFSNLQKTFFFFLFGSFILSNLLTFFFLFILNDLKCYRNTTLSSTNHFCILITTKYHKRNFLGVWEPAFVTFGGFFLEFLTPFTLRGHNFLNYILFLRIFNALDTLIGGFQILFRQKTMEYSP